MTNLSRSQFGQSASEPRQFAHTELAGSTYHYPRGHERADKHSYIHGYSVTRHRSTSRQLGDVLQVACDCGRRATVTTKARSRSASMAKHLGHTADLIDATIHDLHGRR